MECQEVISEIPNSEEKRNCLWNNAPILNCTEFALKHLMNMYFSVNSVITLIYYPILNMAKAWQEMPTKMNPIWIKLFILLDS